MRCFHRLSLCAKSSSTCRLYSPSSFGGRSGWRLRFDGNSNQCPKIFGADKSTKSQLFARSAYCRYKVRISSRFLIATALCSNRLVASFSNLSTSISSPQSLTSCHFDINNSGTSSRAKSFATAFTISLVCGTFSPKNSSPSPYSPGPVLKNPMSTRRCSSFCNDSMYAIISLAFIIHHTSHVPQVLMPTYLRRFKRLMYHNSNSRIANRHGRWALKFPCHHCSPHKSTLLCCNSVFCIPLLAVTGFNLYKVQLPLALSNDVYLLSPMTPIAG